MKMVCTLLALMWPCFLLAAEQRLIEFEDGSRILGEVVAYEHGSYTIRSEALGRFTVSDRQVRSISKPTRGSQSSSTHPTQGASTNPVTSGGSALNQSRIQTIQQTLAGDAAMLQNIMALQSSPEMQAVLSDPEVMAAVKRFVRNKTKFNIIDNHQLQGSSFD